MNLLIVSASQRAGSQSFKVAKFLQSKAFVFDEVNLVDLQRYNLPFWDGDDRSKYIEGSTWPLLEQMVRKADGLVLVTPEWDGMATPLLKNFLMMCSSEDTAHKPALLISVVSGISGAYPIADLRMTSLKNNKIVALPDHIIVRNVEQVLNDEHVQSDRDQSLRQRIDYSLHMLEQYSGALSSVRNRHDTQPFPNQSEYSYGM